MFVWYAKPDVCYAYLEDVDFADYKLGLPKSSWFKRGWTLQELIAPADVQFFSNDWQKIGSKRRSASALSRITRVNKSVLKEGLHVYKASVAEKMSWAAERETTRIEDRAYSLLGLFGANMPTLYGEEARAFTRLQNEILNISSDHPISPWQRKSLTAGLLAHSPDECENSRLWRPPVHQVFMNTFGIITAKPDFAPTTHGMPIQLPPARISTLPFSPVQKAQTQTPTNRAVGGTSTQQKTRARQNLHSYAYVRPSPGNGPEHVSGRICLGCNRPADCTCGLYLHTGSAFCVHAAVLATPPYMMASYAYVFAAYVPCLSVWHSL
jgi:hypothetical protein